MKWLCWLKPGTTPRPQEPTARPVLYDWQQDLDTIRDFGWINMAPLIHRCQITNLRLPRIVTFPDPTVRDLPSPPMPPQFTQPPRAYDDGPDFAREPLEGLLNPKGAQKLEDAEERTFVRGEHVLGQRIRRDMPPRVPGDQE